MEKNKTCPICKKQHAGPMVNVCCDAYNWIIGRVKAEHPGWIERDGACPKCVDYYKKLDPKEE